MVILSFVEHVSIEQTPAELLLTWIAGQAQVSDAAHPLPGYPSDADVRVHNILPCNDNSFLTAIPPSELPRQVTSYLCQQRGHL